MNTAYSCSLAWQANGLWHCVKLTPGHSTEIANQLGWSRLNVRLILGEMNGECTCLPVTYPNRSFGCTNDVISKKMYVKYLYVETKILETQAKVF
jgi:hypothetical protein